MCCLWRIFLSYFTLMVTSKLRFGSSKWLWSRCTPRYGSLKWTSIVHGAAPTFAPACPSLHLQLQLDSRSFYKRKINNLRRLILFIGKYAVMTMLLRKEAFQFCPKASVDTKSPHFSPKSSVPYFEKTALKKHYLLTYNFGESVLS
jgi:hypothetical protein